MLYLSTERVIALIRDWCCESITDLLEQEGYDVVRVQDELELGFEDEAIVRLPPRTAVTAIQRIDRQVTEMADQVWHVPDGWV